MVGAEGSPFVLGGNGRAVVLRGSDGAVLIEVRSTAVQPCEDPVSPDARCYPDEFGTARALSGAGGEGIVILFGSHRRGPSRDRGAARVAREDRGSMAPRSRALEPR